MKDFLSKFVDEKLLKFLLVGVFNTLLGMAIMFGLYNLAGFSYWTSSAANYIIGSILSYILNKHFTFRNTSRSWKPVVKFILNIAVCYLLAYGIAKPLTMWALRSFSASIQDNIAMLVGLCLFTGLNYFGQRFFAFKEE